MRIKTISEPIILFETVAMICQYFRKESYEATAERLLGRFGRALKPSQRSELAGNGAIAERLMNSICADIDLENEDFKFFFQPFDTGAGPERNCVARVLVFSMLTLTPMRFDEAMERIKQGWSRAKANGLKVLHFHMHGLNFVSGAGQELPSLFEQIYALDYPQKAKMDTFLAIDRHEYYLDLLESLIRPYARRLEENLSLLKPVYAYSSDFWEMNLDVMSTQQVAALMQIDENAPLTKLNKAYLSLFLFNEIGNSFDDCTATKPEDITTLYIGMAIYPEYTMVLAEQHFSRLSETLKAMGDPIRLEILSKLSRDADYCLSLAQSMDINAGNMSRHLSILHENGLLEKQRLNGRTYFKTDFNALERTFHHIMACLKD